MSSEVTKKTPVDLDGFSGGYSEPARSGEGGGEGGGSGFPGAIKLKFTNEAEWVDRNGDVVRSALVALDVVNRVQKWDGSGGPPLATITLAPGQAWPDIDALNEDCRSEWYQKF